MTYRPDQAVDKLHTLAIDPNVEVTRLTCLPDAGAYEQAAVTFPTTLAAANADYLHIVNKTGTKYAIWLDKTSEAEVFTATFPATAAATQADYLYFESTSGIKTAVWLDIDAAGVAPTGAIYTAAALKIEANIVAGGTAIDTALAVFTALTGQVTGFTMVNNGDGTITFTASERGTAPNAAGKNADDSGAGSITTTIDNEGVAAVPPTGALYLASNFQIKVEIATGGTAANNAALAKAAIEANGDWDEFTIVNAGSGVLQFTSTLLGNLTNAVPKKEDDSAAGTIAVAVTAGVASSLQNKYFIMRNAAGSVFNAWINVGGEGVDPNPAGTEIACACVAGSTAAQIAQSIATAVNANGNFKSWVQSDYLYVANEATGNATDVTAGNSGFTVTKIGDGSAGQTYPSKLSTTFVNEPSLIA